MKRLLVVWLVLLSLVAALPALASDISNAKYRGVIVVSNNSTAASEVATVGNWSTQTFIDGGFLNATATDAAIRNTSGTDVAFQPGVAGNQWAMWVPSIGEDAYLSYLLYTGNVTGGKIRYFPSTAGMTTTDNATLELGSDFEIEQKGYVDVTAGSGKYLVNKQDAIAVYVDPSTAGAINASIAETLSVYSSTSDAHNLAQDAVYNTVWTAAVGGVTTGSPISLGQRWTGAVYQIYRTGFYFDTSSLPDDAIITSATLKLYGQSDTSTTDFDITIVNGQPTYPTDPMAVGDYNKTLYSGNGGTLTTAGFNLAGYNDIALNSTGMGWISKTGTTKLMLRSSRDIAGTQPVGDEYVSVYSTEQAGTANDPQLVITYFYPQVSVSGLSSGEKTVTTTADLNNPVWATGNVLHFDGTGTSLVNLGNLYGASPKLWWSVWVKLDAAWTIGGGDKYIISDYVNNNNRLVLYFESISGKVKFTSVDTGVVRFAFTNPDITSWAAGTWYHILASVSSVNGARLLVNGGVAATDANTSPVFAGTNIYLGLRNDGINGMVGHQQNVVMGTDDLTPAEETALYNGTAPGDETDYWYIDEGTGNTIYSYGSAANNGTKGANATWTTSTYTAGQTGRLADFTLQVDSTRVGGNLESLGVSAGVPDNANDWYFVQNGSMPYMESQEITIAGVQTQFIEWEYGTTFTDQSGNGQDATPTFRNSSSDPDVIATLTSFAPVSESKAPAYSAGAGGTLITTTHNVTGEFQSTTATNVTIPGAQAIEDAATASSTPSLLPFTILSAFVLLTIWLTMGWLLRRFGTGHGTLFFKIGFTWAVMGFFVATHVMDFWQLVFWIILSLAIASASQHQGFSGVTGELNLIGFLAMAFVGMTLINRVLEGAFITSTDVGIINTLTFTKSQTIFGTFAIPVPNTDFFFTGIPRLVKWDYAFFGGNAGLMQYFLYSFTAVVSFMAFTVVVGLLAQYFLRTR